MLDLPRDGQPGIVAPAKRCGKHVRLSAANVFEEQPAGGGATAPEGPLAEQVAVRAALAAEGVAASVGTADGAGDLDRVGPSNGPKRRFLPAQLCLDFGEETAAYSLRALEESVHTTTKIVPAVLRAEVPWVTRSNAREDSLPTC